MDRTLTVIRTNAFSALLALVLYATTVAAADMRRFTLTDGSVITGELVEAKDGIYTIRSVTLGTVTLNSTQIRGIEAADTPAASDSHLSDRATDKQLDTVEQRIMNDQDLMQLITKLQSDPQFEEILNDPEIMNAIQFGNVAALESNPKIRKLLDNPAVQEINKKLAP